MNLKRRYRLGFAFGKFEHQTREVGYLLLLIGTALLTYGVLVNKHWPIVAALSSITLCLLFETVSYIAHRLEKKTMDKIRFGGN